MTTGTESRWDDSIFEVGSLTIGDVTAGTIAASKVVVVDANKRAAGIAGLTSSVAGVVAGFFPTAVAQAINANGAINLTSYNTNVTSVTTTGQAFTLAAGAVIGHMKRIQLIVDGADATVTFNTNATLVFADAGDVAELIWTGTAWSPIALFNCADGATAPAYTAAS
jgi:hypothetical protein